MKKCTKTLNRLSLTLLFICFVWFAKAQTASFPFPQNYNYAYGIKATNSDPTIIQARFAEWKAKYYVESGTQARIKYLVPGEDGSATLSEDIGYGMLIMLYLDNAKNQTHACFDKLYNYYKANLDTNGLMNAKTNAFTGNVLLANSVSSADIDVAQALLLADKQWGSAGTINYLSDASSLIQKIWTYETQAYNGSQIVKTSDNSSSLLNPSYSIINAFNLFATNDINSSHNWLGLAKNSYSVINKTANATTGLVPDWAFPDGSLIGVGSNVGDACASIANAEGIACDQYQSYFLYDAVKTPWRMAQAYAWYGDVDAKNIAGAIANWSNTKFLGYPSNAFDGYNLDGTVISGLTTSGFTTKGKYHNALFAGGLGISGMVDANYQDYINATWTKASISEGANSQSSTVTPQLLLLLLMSGNMPNLLDLNPSPVKAYNNSTGGCNTIYVSFNKALNASSVTASASSWSVTANNVSTPISYVVNSVALSNDGKTLALSLAAPTEDPLIKVSYSAISKISSLEGKMLDAFTNLSVEDVNACARAYSAFASTNIYSDTLRIVFSKSMLASSFVLSDFLVKVNGTTVTPLAVFADVNDPTLLIIKIGSGIATSTSKITVSYTKGSLKSLDGGSPNSFSDFTVTNAIPCGCCETIEAFDMLANKWTTWSPGTMSTTTTDPVGTSIVGKFTKGYTSSSMSNQYVAVKGELPQTTSSDSTLNVRMLKNAVLKMRVYVSKAGAAIRVRLQDRYKGTSNAFATSLNQTCTVVKANTWTNVAFDFSSQLPTTTNLNEIQIDLEPDIAISVSETMYFDDIYLCPVSATTKIVHGNTSIDDSQIKLECNTEMSVPTNFTNFTIVPTNTITSIAIDPSDNKSIILNMATPFAQTDAITISYSGNTVKGLNGLKLLPFSKMQIVNLMGRTVTNGWIDNFNVDNTVNSVDVTQNIGGDNLYTRVENISGIGTYSVTAKASTINSGDYNSWGPNVSPVSSAEVWDISADPVVRFSVAIPAGETVYVRADVVDLVNNRATDGLLPIKLIADGQQHSYTIDFTNKLINNYGIIQGPVDAKNIVTVNLYQWENDGLTTPKLWTGTAVYDWLSVGSTTKIYNTSTDTVALETNAHATSSADGEIYLVPSNTARAIETLKDVVSKGLGVKVTAAKDVAVSIPTTNLTQGSYIMYAFNPSNNDLSRQSNEIQINALSPCPLYTPAMPHKMTVPLYKGSIILKTGYQNAIWFTNNNSIKTTLDTAAIYTFNFTKADTTFLIWANPNNDKKCPYPSIPYYIKVTNDLPSSKLDTTYYISLHDSVVFSSIYSTVTHDSLGYTNSDTGPWFSYHVGKESLVGAMDTVSQISLKKSVFENGTFIYTLKPKKIGVDTIVFVKADSSMIYGTNLYLDSAVVHGKKLCYMIIHITPSATDTCPIIKMNPVQAKVCSSTKSLLSVVSSKTYTYDYKPQNVNPIDTIVNYKIKYVGGVVGILNVDTGITVAFNNGCKVSAVMKDTSFTFVQSPSAPKVHDFYYKVNEDKILYLDEASGKNGKASWYCPSYGKIMFLGDTITVNGISTIGDYPFTVSITDTILKCSSNESGFTLYIKDTSYISCPKIAMEAVNIPICTPEKSVPECWAIQYHYSYIPQGVEPVDTLYSWAQYTALEVGTHTVDYTVVFNNACKVKVSNTVNVTLHQTPKFPTIHEFNYDSNAVKTLYLDSIPNSNCIVRWHRDWVDYGLGNSVLVPFDSIGKYMIYITLTDTVEKCSSIGNTYLNIKDPKLPSISGTVNADGNPFSNGTVQLFEQNGADYTAVAADSIHTDGTFTFKWLKTTKYLVRALPSANQNNYVPSYYVNAIQWQDASVIDLKGKIMGLDLTLVPKDVSTSGTGSISGTVDLQDTSFASKQKALYSLQMTVIVMKAGKVVAYGLTDFDGNYSINNLADGNYDVYVEMPGYTKWSQSVSITNGSSSQAFFTLKNGETTSVTDVSANTDEVIYPNPASDNISISTNKIFKTIQIINVDGVVVIENRNSEITISVASLPSGFYIIKMISDNQTIIKTFVKQ